MNRRKEIMKTSAIGIIMNIVLVIFKAIIGFTVNSIAIVLDALNNLTDVLSSVITIIGTKLAGKQPDKEHPYGHGRIEYFTATIISVIILSAGIYAIKESFMKIIKPWDASYSLVSMFFIVVAVIVKYTYSLYAKKIGKKVNSQSLIASGQDAFMDAILSFTTLVAAILNYAFNWKLEGYLGVIIGIVIINSSIEILKDSVNPMLGVRADGEISKKIKDKINSFEDVQGTYDLNLHNYGPSSIVASAHIQVRNDMTAEKIHILTRNIEYEVYEEFGIALTLGIYAANDSGEYGKIQKELQKVLKEYPCVLQSHGFYVEKDQNVYFDLIIDFGISNKDDIKNEIISKLRKKYPKYNYNIIIDSDITD